MSTPDGKKRVEGGVIISSLCKDQNSYRTELGGQLGMSIFVESIVVPYGEYKIKIA